MCTLKDIYIDILDLSKKTTNCYYYNDSYYIGINKDNSAEEFIKHYFSQGQKALEEDIIRYLDKMRFEHMRSSFLLGVYLYNQLPFLQVAFGKKIDRYIKKAEEQDDTYKCENERVEDETRSIERIKFLYLWFLTCLYHDVGYIYEDLHDSLLSQYFVQRKRGFKREVRFIQTKRVSHKIQKIERICKYIVKEISCPKLKIDNNIPDSIQENYKKYYKLRLLSKRLYEDICIDHGIAGGLRLYDYMKKKHYNNCNDNRQVKLVNNLWWGPVIFENFIVPCVEAIIAHNVWFSLNDKCDQKYKVLGLEGLVLPKQGDYRKSPITYNEYPLLFLLDLVDTIEPIKFWKKALKNKYKWHRTSKNGEYLSFFENTKIEVCKGNNCECVVKYKFENLCKNINSKHENINRALLFLKSDTFNSQVKNDCVELKFSGMRPADNIIINNHNH